MFSRRKRIDAAVVIILFLSFFIQNSIFTISPAQAATSNGSISINGTTDWLTVPGSSDWTIASNQDFTIEWWQYNNSTSSFPRIFSVGSYPSSSIAVSQEGGTLYFWMGGTFRATATMSSTNRTWENYAVTRTSGSIRIFKNGTQIGSTVTGNTTAATDSSSNLYIGREANDGNTLFRGYITDFHFVKGTSKYASNFTVTSSPITAISDSKLLLNAATAATYVADSSGNSKTITAVGTPTWNASSPYNSVTNLTTPTFSLSGTACTTSGQIVNIDAVANASSYTARLYSSIAKTTLLKTETNFVSESRISGLTSSTTYYLTIQAIGDGINYSDSQETFTATSYATNSTSCAPALSSGSFSSNTVSSSTAILNFDSIANASSYTVKIYDSSSGGTLIRTINNYVSGATISSLSESTNYYATLTAVGDGTNYSNSSESSPRYSFTTVASAAIPSSPTLNNVNGGDRSLTITFTANSDGGSSITDYEYSLNGSSYISAGTTSSPFTITGLNGRTAYSVTLKARNSVGLSSASTSLSATTTDSSLDAREAAAAEAARVAAAAAEAARAAAAKQQKELTEILSIIPELGKLSLNLGKTSQVLSGQKCVKGKKVKFVSKNKKCPKGFSKK